MLLPAHTPALQHATAKCTRQVAQCCGGKRMSTMQQNSRVTSFAIDREYDYIMYDTTDMIRAMNFPREIAGLLLKTDEFHLSLFEVLGDYGVDEAGEYYLMTKQVRGKG